MRLLVMDAAEMPESQYDDIKRLFLHDLGRTGINSVGRIALNRNDDAESLGDSVLAQLGMEESVTVVHKGYGLTMLHHRAFHLHLGRTEFGNHCD